MNVTTVPPSSSQTPLLSNRNFILLWAGQSISLLGDAIFNLTLVVWVAVVLAKQQPWAPLAVSGMLAAETLPVLLVGPLAGVFVDRWNKRWTMLWMDLLRTLLIASLILGTNVLPLPFLTRRAFSPLVQLAGTYSIVFLAAVCTQFFSPARLALLGDIVDESQRTQAASMQQVTQSLVNILGPPLAAPLLFGFGVQWALLINALSFGFSFLAIAAVRPPASARSLPQGHTSHIGKEFLQGIRFILHHQMVRTLLIGGIVIELGAGAINALEVFFFTQNLHTPVTWIGLFNAVSGAGIIAGALLSGIFAQRIGLARTYYCGVLSIGVVFIVLARMTSWEPALGIMILLGIFQGVISVTSGPLVLQVTPRELIGRVISVLVPASMVASLVSVALVGYLVSTVLRDLHATVLNITFGPIDTIFTGAGILIALGGLYFLKNRWSGSQGAARYPQIRSSPDRQASCQLVKGDDYKNASQ